MSFLDPRETYITEVVRTRQTLFVRIAFSIEKQSYTACKSHMKNAAILGSVGSPVYRMDNKKQIMVVNRQSGSVNDS